MEAKERLMSLDALRGADMLFIILFAKVITAFCALIGFSDCWLAMQMNHVSWGGFRHHDTIFPLFPGMWGRMLSDKGNPQLSSLTTILESAGLRLAVQVRQPYPA